MLETEAAGVLVKTAGEVEMSPEWAFTGTVDGKNLLSNPLARTVMLSTIRLTKADGSDCSTGQNNMNLITENGGAGAKYSWMLIGRDPATAHWGWVTGGKEVGKDIEDVPFPIGSGFILETEAVGVKVIFRQ